MFYSQIILAKKGPLGKVWQAAHWGDKKLGRPAIFATDISSTVDTIVHPAAPMALRVSGHLLLGVVRIYSRQVKYLADDCQAAMVKVKMAYKTSTTSATAGGGTLETGGGAETNAITRAPNNKTSNLNVANFGEYYADDADIEIGGILGANFEIPFDLNAETAPEDWIPATLDESTLNIDADTTTAMDGVNDSSTVGGVTAAADRTLESSRNDDENWGVFDPFDGEEEEGEKRQGAGGDESTVSSVEQPRAATNDQSMTSDPQLRRASVLNNESNDVSVQAGETSDHEFPIDDGGADVFGEDEEPPAMQDDEESAASKRKSLNLELSRDDSSRGDAGISFGEDDASLSPKSTTTSKKRMATKARRSRKKRRKIVLDKTVELSNDHIRKMLADTSDIVLDNVVHPATWVPGQPIENVELTDKQILYKHLSYEELFARPALADDGQLAPELLALFKRNTARVVGKPFAYPLRDETDEDQSTSRGAGDETTVQQDKEMEDVEQARNAQEEDGASPTANKDQEDEASFPQDDDDNMFPQDDDGGIPFDDQQEEEQVAMQDEGMVDSPSSQRSFETIFSLGATNALEDDEFGAEEEDRQQQDETTTTTSKWHKNTLKVFDVLKKSMAVNDDDEEEKILSFRDMSKGVSRRTAAGVFFELLQLKTLNYIELDQAESYGDVKISPGVKFMEDPPSE